MTMRLARALALSVGVGMLVAATGVFAQPAPGANPGTMALAQACRGDVARFCPDVRPGGGRIAACLRANAAELSQGCRAAALASMRDRSQAEPTR
ncbi:cysteine rich repeat-containing protein [Rhabdaerophilum calidifontis]|uniref:cysteine rich repeat-containing protein n=1 Tax=Rhabdaerophilum calidifontis TaxID=2604328 RepID=UPI001FE76F5B|nr:cysteine rich repeat-containing protein [Rhabdaerophilum calidifontis]